ncbi:MAG TPA: DinB family protein [Cyclobacteriaceae bacterium]|nr:DinB family protein [Cyclobacteriaceae bacterium]
MDKTRLEVWQRGPIEGVPDLLQPVAHALLQSSEDAGKYTEDFPDELLWEKPFGMASVGFHLNHLTGVVDRLFAYADNKKLTEAQLKFLKAEENPENELLQTADLVEVFQRKVQQAVEFLKQTSTDDLTEFRGLGRAQIPTTKLGLLFHAAEHSQRHIGQLLVTVRVLMGNH